MDTFDLKKFITEGRLLKEASYKNRNQDQGHVIINAYLESEKVDPNDIGWTGELDADDFRGFENSYEDRNALLSVIRDIKKAGGRLNLFIEPYDLDLTAEGDVIKIEVVGAGVDGFGDPIRENAGGVSKEKQHLLKWLHDLQDYYDGDHNHFEVDDMDPQTNGDGTDLVHDFIVYLNSQYDYSGTTPDMIDDWDVDDFLSTWNGKDYSSDFVNEGQYADNTIEMDGHDIDLDSFKWEVYNKDRTDPELVYAEYTNGEELAPEHYDAIYDMYWDDLNDWVWRYGSIKLKESKTLNEEEAFTLTPEQEEFEADLQMWDLQQCEEISPGVWSVLWIYQYYGNNSSSYNMEFKADSYEEAEYKAYVYTLDNLS